MVNSIMTYTLSIHNQPPKSPNPLNPPCQGDFIHEASIRGTIGERLHIYIVHHNETLQTGAVRKPRLPFSRLVGTVSNCADAVGNRIYRGAEVSKWETQRLKSDCKEISVYTMRTQL